METSMNNSLETLRAAFDKCANPSDWKAPVDFITSRIFGCYSIDTYVEAIEFMTATQGVVTDLGNGSVRIQAAGYRAGDAW